MASSAPPPLLASPEDHNEAPSLSMFTNGGGMAEANASPLERMITMSSSLPPNAEMGLDGAGPASAPSMPTAGIASSNQRHQQIPPGSASTATVIAGTLCVLQFAFTWASFFAKSWFDTFVRTTVDWQSQFLPMLDGLTAFKLRSSTLASILSALNSAGYDAVALCLIVTSLLLPCVCMILCPTWTHSDHKDRMLVQHAGGRSSNTDFRMPRMIFEWLARFSLLALFILMVLDVGMSSITLETEDTTLVLYNKTQGGIMAYALGMFCALGVFVVLRIAGYRSGLRLLYIGRTTTEGRGIPPASAFQLPWQNRRSPRLVGDEHAAPLLGDMDSDTDGNRNGSDASGMCCSFQGCHSFIVFQIGLLACLAWLPALFLPMYEVWYGGLAADYMDDVVFHVAFWEFPALVGQRASDAGTAVYQMLILEVVLVLTVYILPLVATGLAIGVWTMDPDYSNLCRTVLSCIHPMLCGMVFAVSVFAGSMGFAPVVDYVINQEPTKLCSHFHDVTEEPCLSIVGEPLIGAWFVLLQSVFLELFIILSLATYKR